MDSKLPAVTSSAHQLRSAEKPDPVTTQDSNSYVSGVVSKDYASKAALRVAEHHSVATTQPITARQLNMILLAEIKGDMRHPP